MPQPGSIDIPEAGPIARRFAAGPPLRWFDGTRAADAQAATARGHNWFGTKGRTGIVGRLVEIVPLEIHSRRGACSPRRRTRYRAASLRPRRVASPGLRQ